MKKKQEPEITSKIIRIDFPNDDGTVDEWVYETTRTPWITLEVTQNIRRRPKVIDR